MTPPELTPPAVDGLDIAVRYRPGQPSAGLGGDWYDTVVNADGDLVVVIGDVAGHGAGAVARMTHLRSLIRAALNCAVPLERVWWSVNHAIEDGPGLYATAQLFRVDHRGQRLGYSNAGHPWALIRPVNGPVRRLDHSQRPPLGVPAPPTPLTYVDFPAGSLLLAYTDGLIERPERSIVEGIDRLAAVLATLDRTASIQDVLDEVVSTARPPDQGGEPHDDDVTALVIRTHHG